MKKKQPETCCASLLRTQCQLELLINLMTQEHLPCVQAYKKKEAHLINQRSQALREFACWLCQMGLQNEMLQLMQQGRCIKKRQVERTARCSQEKAKVTLQGKQLGGAS